MFRASSEALTSQGGKMVRKISLTKEDRTKLDEIMQEGKKIAGIKFVRDVGRAIPADPDRNPPNRPGISEAKDAIDVAYCSENIANRVIKPRAVFGSLFKVKSIVVDVAGEGDVELDLESLQMRFLQELTELGLSEVQHLLKLIEFVQEWQEA